MATWQVGFVKRTLIGKHIHWARILWFTTRQHIAEALERSMNYLSQFFMNFYRGMGLLIEAELKRFLLQIEATNRYKKLSGNEVDSEEDDTKLALPSAKVDRSRIKVEERP